MTLELDGLLWKPKPGTAVIMSRSPPRQPSAVGTVRSAILPDESMRPIP